MSDAPAILIVEDRGIVAAKIRRDVEGAGFTVLGMAPKVATAKRLAATLPVRAAVLDINLSGEQVFPVATVLRRRAIPFLFLTGYGRGALPAEWQGATLLEKPFVAEALARALRSAVRGDPGEPVEPAASTPAIRFAWEVVRHTRDLVTEQLAWAEAWEFLLVRPGD